MERGAAERERGGVGTVDGKRSSWNRKSLGGLDRKRSS
jgi:hypothetical protein